MTRFYGKVGYVVTDETVPGVWGEVVTERMYYGDVLKNTKRNQGTDTLNDDVSVNNLISVLADPFAYGHFFAMKYVEWMGSKWKITNVEVNRPRLILTIGGVYNEP